jgi:tryptophanyl-tRNA synthetase
MLSATEAETAALIKKAKTDAERRITYEPDRRPEVANLLRILSLSTGTSPEALAEDIGDGGGGKLKQALTEALNTYLRPIRARRAELAAQPSYIREVLERGIQRAREVGAQTLDDVRGAMNMRI